MNEGLFSLYGRMLLCLLFISTPALARPWREHIYSSYYVSLTRFCRQYFLFSFIRLKTYKLILHTIQFILPNFSLVQRLDCFSWLLIFVFKLDENALRLFLVHELDECAQVFSLFYSGKSRRYISASREFIHLEFFSLLRGQLGRKQHGDLKFTQHFVHNINIVYR